MAEEPLTIQGPPRGHRLNQRELRTTVSRLADMLEQPAETRRQAVEIAAGLTGGQIHPAAPWIAGYGCISWFKSNRDFSGCVFPWESLYEIRRIFRYAALWIWHESGPLVGTPKERAPRDSLVGAILHATCDRFPIWWVRSRNIKPNRLGLWDFFEGNPALPYYPRAGAKRLVACLDEIEQRNAGRYPALTGLCLYLRAVLPSGSRRAKARRLAKLLLGVS